MATNRPHTESEEVHNFVVQLWAAVEPLIEGGLGLKNRLIAQGWTAQSAEVIAAAFAEGTVSLFFASKKGIVEQNYRRQRQE